MKHAANSKLLPFEGGGSWLRKPAPKKAAGHPPHSQIGIALALVAPTLATAQSATDFQPTIGGAIQTVKIQTKPPQRLPADITRTDRPKIPEPDPRYSKKLRVIRFGHNNSAGDTFSVTDGAEIEYQGYHITSDSVTGNTVTRVFDFSGKVHIRGAKADIVGDHVRVNFADKTYEADDTRSVIYGRKASRFLLDNLYVRAEESYGTQLDSFYEHSDTTTCSYSDDPHFHLVAKSSEVRTNKRLILRHVDFFALHKHLFSLPYLVIPLDEQTSRYTPELGRNSYEGYYEKTKYAIPLAAGYVLYHFDYFSKLGNGLGADWKHEGSRGQNTFLRAYTILSGPHELLLQTQDALRWGNTQISLSSDYSKNNHLLLAGTESLSSRLGFVIPQRTGSSRLNFSFSENGSSGFKYDQRTATLDDTRRFGSNTNSILNLTYTHSGSTSTGSTINSDRQQLDTRFSLNSELRSATALLEYQRSIPIGSAASYFSVSDRTPVLTLTSDAQRLHTGRFLPDLRTSASIGQYTDASVPNAISRSNFLLDVDKSSDSTKRFSYNWNGHFQQSLYSDRTAQFVGGYGANATYRLGTNSAWNIRYNELRPQGYTPLSFDRYGRTDLLTSDISYNFSKRFAAGAQTGFDFWQAAQGQPSWQQIGLRTEYNGGQNSFVRSLATYDTINRDWSNVRIDAGLRRGPSYFTVGTLYDAPRHTWGTVNLFAGGLRFGRTSADIRLGYNGYLNRFDNQQAALVYDLHCWEAIVQYQNSLLGFTPGRSIQFFLRLKAIPFDTLFGAARNGSILGTGTGRNF